MWILHRCSRASITTCAHFATPKDKIAVCVAAAHYAAPARRQVLKSVAGQSAFQLAAMYALVFHGDALFGVPPAAAVQGPSVHYTLVFNAFVMMQLFNQARPRAPGLHARLTLLSAPSMCMHACIVSGCFSKVLWFNKVQCARQLRHACCGTCTGTARHAGSHAECAGTRIHSQLT